MMIKIRKFLSITTSFLLIIVLFSFGLPFTTINAKAAILKSETNSYLGTSIFENDCNTDNSPIIYFDGENDRWYVIGYNGNGVACDAGEMTLFATGKLIPSSYTNHRLTINLQKKKKRL